MRRYCHPANRTIQLIRTRWFACVLYLTSDAKKTSAEISVAIGSRLVKKITASEKDGVTPDSDGYRFPSGIRVVVATSVLNSGIEYKDPSITAVVVEMPTPVDVTQGIWLIRTYNEQALCTS